MVWLVVVRTIGWAYVAMFRPLMLTTAWVCAILWVVSGPLNILNAFIVKASLSRMTEWLSYTAAHIVQFALGYYLLRYLWRSSRAAREETVRGDAQQPAP
jgi:hypothetical protein